MKEGTGQVTKKLLPEKNSFENEWSDKPTKGSKEMNEWDIYKQTRKFSNRCKKKTRV